MVENVVHAEPPRFGLHFWRSAFTAHDTAFHCSMHRYHLICFLKGIIISGLDKNFGPLGVCMKV